MRDCSKCEEDTTDCMSEAGSEAIDLAVPPVLSEVAYGLGDPAEKSLSTSPSNVTSLSPERATAGQTIRARHSSAGSPVQNLISFASAADAASSSTMTPLLSVSPSAGRSFGKSQPHSPIIGADQASEAFPQQKVAAALDNLLEPDVPRPSSGLHTDEDDIPDALGSYADRTRRQSFMSYADIINAERSDPHSAMVSPAPSGAVDGPVSDAPVTGDVAGTNSSQARSSSPPTLGAYSPLSRSIGSFTQLSPPSISREASPNRRAAATSQTVSSINAADAGSSSTWDMLGIGKVLNSAAEALSGVVGGTSSDEADRSGREQGRQSGI